MFIYICDAIDNGSFGLANAFIVFVMVHERPERIPAIFGNFVLFNVHIMGLVDAGQPLCVVMSNRSMESVPSCWIESRVGVAKGSYREDKLCITDCGTGGWVVAIGGNGKIRRFTFLLV